MSKNKEETKKRFWAKTPGVFVNAVTGEASEAVPSFSSSFSTAELEKSWLATFAGALDSVALGLGLKHANVNRMISISTFNRETKQVSDISYRQESVKPDYSFVCGKQGWDILNLEESKWFLSQENVKLDENLKTDIVHLVKDDEVVVEFTIL